LEYTPSTTKSLGMNKGLSIASHRLNVERFRRVAGKTKEKEHNQKKGIIRWQFGGGNETRKKKKKATGSVGDIKSLVRRHQPH